MKPPFRADQVGSLLRTAPVKEARTRRLAGEITPAEAVEALEELDVVMRRLDPQEREILEMRLAGYTVDEIAAHQQRTDRTIRRAMERVREEFRRRYPDAPLP